MSKITRSKIKNFFLEKKGYIKKSPKDALKRMWKDMSRSALPKTVQEVQQELDLVRDVQADIRAAKTFVVSKEQQDIHDIYNKILEKKTSKRRLFFDIEVSPNIVFSWSVGNKIPIGYENIIKERAIICICYKWENEGTVHSLKWDNGDDRNMLVKFAKVIDSADEVIGQNSDNFDIKWLRTRCLFHRISISAKFNSIDTLKMARAGFRFNSNRLDYMGKFLGLGQKNKTEYELWKAVVLYNDSSSIAEMVEYCKQDVILLENVYTKLQEYSPTKKFKYKP